MTDIHEWYEKNPRGFKEYQEDMEKVMGLSVKKELVDKYYINRENKPLDDKVSFKDIKPIKSII